MQADDGRLTLDRRCELLGLSRSSCYYKSVAQTPETEALMRLLDQHYTQHPHEGKVKRARWLSDKVGYQVGRKRVKTLMSMMGIETVYPKPNTSAPNKENRIYPYLLKGIEINAPNQVWSTDITYIPLLGSHVYLMAIIDWYSRYVIEWTLSPTLEADAYIQALQAALSKETCLIFNTDQGSQFTSKNWLGVLTFFNIKISMDGQGRYLDNIFVERLWRSVKQECIYLNDFNSVLAVKQGLTNYFEYYNNTRLHQSLDYKTPAQIHAEKGLMNPD